MAGVGGLAAGQESAVSMGGLTTKVGDGSTITRLHRHRMLRSVVMDITGSPVRIIYHMQSVWNF